MTSSILTDVKKVLGIAEDYTDYDLDIMMHINTVFSTLNQMGVGPADGFMIEDKTVTWDDFLGTDKTLNLVKTYMCLRVRTWFDPPTTHYLITAIENQVKELEWRLNTVREGTSWTPPPAPAPDPVMDPSDLWDWLA